MFIRRLFGKNLHDTFVLASQFYAGFPTRQWLNLLANVDAQAVFMTSLPLEQRKSYKPLVQSTTPSESSFSQIPQVRGTSTIPTRRCPRSKENLRSWIALQT